MDCQSFWVDSTSTAVPLGRGLLGLGNQLSDEPIASITRWARTLGFIDKAFKMEKNNQVNNGPDCPAATDNPDYGSYYTAPTTPTTDCRGVLGKRPRPLSPASSSNDYWYHAGSNWDPSGFQGVFHVTGTVENPRPYSLKRVCVQRDHLQYTQETQYEHGTQHQYGPSVSAANSDAPGLYTTGPSFDSSVQNHAANQHTAPIYAAAHEHGVNSAPSSGVPAHEVPAFENTFPSNRAGIRPPPGFEHVVPQNHGSIPSAPGLEHVSHAHPSVRRPPGFEGAAPQNGAELRSPGIATPYNRWERNSSCTSIVAVNGDVQLQELKARFPNVNTNRLSAASDDEDRIWFAPAPVEVFRQSPRPVPWDPSRAERLAGLCGAPVSLAPPRKETPKQITMDDAEGRALWKTGIPPQDAVAYPSHQAALAYPHTSEAYKIGMHSRQDVVAYPSHQAARAYRHTSEAYKTWIRSPQDAMAYHHTSEAYKQRLEKEEMERQRKRLAARSLHDEFTPSEAIWGTELIRKWKQNRP